MEMEMEDCLCQISRESRACSPQLIGQHISYYLEGHTSLLQLLIAHKLGRLSCSSLSSAQAMRPAADPSPSRVKIKLEAADVLKSVAA